MGKKALCLGRDDFPTGDKGGEWDIERKKNNGEKRERGSTLFIETSKTTLFDERKEEKETQG